MDIRVVGDDNRESIITIPDVTNVESIKKLIGEALIVEKKHIMDLHLQKAVITTSDDGKEVLMEEYDDIFIDIDLKQEININNYFASGETIYIDNITAFSDPNVWKLNIELNKLFQISQTLNQTKYMQFVELITKICENIIENPKMERFRHLNYAKIEKKISNIPYSMNIFKYIGFIKKSDKDFNFTIMNSLQPLKHILKCIYLKYPALRPKDTKFMALFDSFDTSSNQFDIEKEQKEEEMEQKLIEQHEYYRNLANPDAVVNPSTGTKIAHGVHVITENAVLFVIIGCIGWWLLKAIFKF